jgi:tetratricopeptide (TPR) repeat protein
LQPEQATAVLESVDALARRMAEAPPNGRTDVAAAFAALADGNLHPAESLFERELGDDPRFAPAARQASEAARNVANLALLHDVPKAVQFYRQALEHESESADTNRLLGHALALNGDFKGATDAFVESHTAARALDDVQAAGAAERALGGLVQRQVNAATVAESWVNALARANRSLLVDMADLKRQQRFSKLNNRLGMLVASGACAKPLLVDYCGILDKAQPAAAGKPILPAYTYEIATGYGQIAKALLEQQDPTTALSAYGSSRALLQNLVDHDPDNARWQADLSAVVLSIGKFRS